MMSLSPLLIEDIEGLGRLAPPGWGSIGPIHRFYIGSDFCEPFAIREAGAIIGIGTLILYRHSAWLAHIIVDEEKRNRGIGACIVAGLLEMVDRDRFPTVSLIATDLGAPVYAKAGFRVIGELASMERAGPRNEAPEDGRIGPLREDEKDAALALDLRANGDDRSALLGPALKDAIAYRDSGRLKGFFIPGLGDGPILAEDAEAGGALVALRAASADAAKLPLANADALAVLTGLGFAEKKRMSKMVLGPNLMRRPNLVYNRVGGNFG